MPQTPWTSLLPALFSWSRLQQLNNQQAAQLSFIVITPVVLAMVVVMWRKGALAFKTMLALAAACLFISWFLYSNLTG